MANINLLPWREAERKRRQRDFGIMLVSGLVMALVVSLLVHVHVNSLIEQQNRRNIYLEGEIAVLNRRIKEIQELEKTKANLIARMNIIQRLQESRPEIVHLFEELVDTLPDGVLLTRVAQSSRSLNLVGHAQSNARVSSYMRNIDGSDWIGGARLKVIAQSGKKHTSMNNFTLNAKQVSKKAKKKS